MEWIRQCLGYIMYGVYMFSDFFGVNSAAVCIVLFTILMRALMIPLTIKQQKFQKLSSVMSPEIQKVQAKYKGKKDQESLQKQQQEMQVIYDKYGTSPTAGCLPMLIQIPIFIGLYGVVSDMAKYIKPIGSLYRDTADAMMKSGVDYADMMKKYAETYKVSFSNNTDGIVTVLQRLSRDEWKDLIKQFASSGEYVSRISKNSDKIIHINRFVFGLNMSERPSLDKWVSMLIPATSVLTQWYQTKQANSLTTNQQGKKDDNPTMQSMQTVTKVMPIMSGVFCMFMPIGVGVYWITGNIFVIIQQYIMNKHFEKIDLEDLIKENVERSSKKNKKSTMSDRLRQKLLDADATQENANKGKTLRDYANINSKKTDLSKKSEENETVNKGSSSNDVDNIDNVRECKKGSISSYANIMNTKNTK